MFTCKKKDLIKKKKLSSLNLGLFFKFFCKQEKVVLNFEET